MATDLIISEQPEIRALAKGATADLAPYRREAAEARTLLADAERRYRNVRGLRFFGQASKSDVSEAVAYVTAAKTKLADATAALDDAEAAHAAADDLMPEAVAKARQRVLDRIKERAKVLAEEQLGHARAISSAQAELDTLSDRLDTQFVETSAGGVDAPVGPLRGIGPLRGVLIFWGRYGHPRPHATFPDRLRLFEEFIRDVRW